MKRQRILSFFSLRMLWGTPHFVFLTMMLLVGALAGSFTGLRSGQAEDILLEQLADAMVAQARQTGSAGGLALNAVVTGLAWELAALCAGALRPHSLLPSAVCAARGFLMAFSAGALLSALGWPGLALAALTGGISAVVTVPCLLMTAAASFLAGQEAGRGGFWYAMGRYRGTVLTCIGLALLGSLLRVPMLFLAARLPF
ncbi:MAG: hypothetical protein MR451_06355 [Clostridiales bacterium]|nr:hypothetical protein [Clostridiales bacterium]